MSIMWMKDANGNWYYDGPMLTKQPEVPSSVWDKNENGAWFLSETDVISLGVPSLFPHRVFSRVG